MFFFLKLFIFAVAQWHRGCFWLTSVGTVE